MTRDSLMIFSSRPLLWRCKFCQEFWLKNPPPQCYEDAKIVDPVSMLANAAKYLGDTYTFDQETDSILRDAWESIISN